MRSGRDVEPTKAAAVPLARMVMADAEIDVRLC